MMHRSSCPRAADERNECCDCGTGDRRATENMRQSLKYYCIDSRRELARVVRKARAEFGGCMPRRQLNVGLQQFIDNRIALEKLYHGQN